MCRIKYVQLDERILVSEFEEIADDCWMETDKDHPDSIGTICKSRIKGEPLPRACLVTTCPLCKEADMQDLKELDNKLYKEYLKDPDIQYEIKRGEALENIGLPDGGEWVVQWGKYVRVKCNNPSCKHWSNKQ